MTGQACAHDFFFGKSDGSFVETPEEVSAVIIPCFSKIALFLEPILRISLLPGLFPISH